MRSNSRPCVSILIPNYNNGRAASRDGVRNFILDLLKSLETTLASETTPFELLVFDDGSTDDSIDTLREWAGRTWPWGDPFLTLMEDDHCGVLSITANKLSAAARGEFLARLDGDTICLTDNWVSKLCAIFDHGPDRLGVVGPKQLRADGRIHAFGDWLLHPNGYTHIAAGEDRQFARRAMEVDHVMGCFYCCRKRIWEELGGYDEDYLRGQTIDLGLRARLAGWTAWAVPNIEYIHAHGERKPRSTSADTRGGMDRSRRVFLDKWGFDRIAPDLDVVREKYAGTPLLWNPRFFGPSSDADGPSTTEQAALTVESSEWSQFASSDAFRNRINFRRGVALDLIRQIQPKRPVVQIGCGAGLLGHTLAQQGVAFIGVDESAPHIKLARQTIASQNYPGAAPEFTHQDEPARWPLGDASVDLLFLFDILERRSNPVAMLREANRVIREGGILGIISQPKRPLEDSPINAEHRYRAFDLVAQLMAVGGFGLAMDTAQVAQHQHLIVVAQRHGESLPHRSPAVREPVLRPSANAQNEIQEAMAPAA